MRIAYITNSSYRSGVGHRAKNIYDAVTAGPFGKKLVEFNLDGQRGLLSKEGRPVSWVRKWPGMLGSKSVNWIRLGDGLKKYIKGKDKNAYDVFHLTNQSLGWLASGLRPSIVTVHDLIELVDAQNKKAGWINKYLVGGITEADHLIAVSNYTARQIMDYFNISQEKITVVHNGVGAEFSVIDRFEESIANFEIRKELRINQTAPVVLFVGSDHPRKNVKGALNVFCRIKREREDAIFVKVGEPGMLEEREKLLNEIDKMQLRESVRMVGSISDEALNVIYNVSNVLLYPSRHEGFGLPLVQAMACGLPIVAARTSAIPEVVGDAGILVDVEDTDTMAEQCLRITRDINISDDLRHRGLKRSLKFSWEEAAIKVNSVYEKVVL